MESGSLAEPPARAGTRARGYLMTGGASLINGSIGVMVSYATMPTSMLLVLRMAFAGAALAAVVALRGTWREAARPGVFWRLLAIGGVLAVNLLFYFLAIRATGVAVAIFLSYVAPVYVGVAAPRLFRERTESIVYAALGIALLGMATILVPGLAREGARLSASGLFYGWAAGVMYAVYLLLGKSLRRRHVDATTIVFAGCLITTLAVLPLGLHETVGTYSPTRADLLMAAMLGLLTTAVSFSLFMHGTKYIPVQHTSIMGYVEPVSAPLYALVFLAQVPSLWTLAGGALIILAGVLVVALGRPAEEPYPEGELYG